MIFLIRPVGKHVSRGRLGGILNQITCLAQITQITKNKKNHPGGVESGMFKFPKKKSNVPNYSVKRLTSQTNQTDGTGPADVAARGERAGAILERWVGETFHRPALSATSRPPTALWPPAGWGAAQAPTCRRA
jgi:hypothetical protein